MRVRDISTTVYKGTGVDGFHDVQGYNKLNWNLHGRRIRLYSAMNEVSLLKIQGCEGDSSNHFFFFFIILNFFKFEKILIGYFLNFLFGVAFLWIKGELKGRLS